MIIDYKTNMYPVIKQCRKNGENAGVGLGDFQIPMYIKLYEAAGGAKVNRACFVSINQHKIVFVVGAAEGAKVSCSRDDYESALDALEKGIDYFDKAAETLDFDPQSVPGIALHAACPFCVYKTICRSRYALNPRPGSEVIAPAGEDSEDEEAAGEF